jgi:hypothetical protein
MRKLAVLAVLVVVGTVSADFLWDNGSLVNYPGQGFGGYDASAIQSSLFETIYGYGHAVSSGYRVADDFTISDPGGWSISALYFYAYQTGGNTATSTINNVNLRIWSGTPGAGGTVVWGNTTTNLLQNPGSSSVWSGIYRSIDTALTANNRPIQVQTLAFGDPNHPLITLAAGTYWLDWQTGGSLASGPWAPPVSILDATGPAGANARQADPNGAWLQTLDTGNSTADDFPFIIEGTPEPASLLLLSLAVLFRRR